jgi:tetratricopeptide (TPR) repeat protein
MSAADFSEPVASAVDPTQLVAQLQAAASACNAALVSQLAAQLVVTQPTAAKVYREAIRALQAVSRLDEAWELMSGAITRFEDHTWIPLLAAELAIEREDFVEAVRLSEKAIHQFPANPRGYHIQALALRKMGNFSQGEVIIRQAAARFPAEIWPAFERGWIAVGRGDGADALAVLAMLEERLPGDQATFIYSVAALRAAGKYSEAIERAQGALWTSWDEAWPYRELSILLRHVGRLEEAAIVIADARARFRDAWPDEELRLLLEAQPDNQPDGCALIDNIEFLRSRHLYFDNAYAEEAERLLRVHHWDRASALLETLKSYLHLNVRLAICYADLAILDGDFSAAEGRLTQLRLWFPDAPEGYVRLSKVLGRLGRHTEADSLASEAVDRFPHRWDVFDAYARVAMLSGDNATAAARWRSALERFPTEARLKDGLHDAELASFESQSSASMSVAEIPGHDTTETYRQTMLHFQNIGSPTHGCEFGNVQRFYGAEPLGLLRWVAAKPDALARAVRDRFEGFWDESDTHISLGPVPQRPEEREYRLYFSRYEMHLHTFIYMSEVSEEEFIKKYRLRQKLLARKFFEDLEAGDSIFVYKQDLDDIPDREVEGLLAALQEYGSDVAVLFVKKADSYNPATTVRWARPGLMIGYISEVIIRSPGEEGPIKYEEWLSICGSAYEMRRAALDERVHITQGL